MKSSTIEEKTTEDISHWFSAYNRSDFTEYVKIHSYLDAAYWASGYYAILSKKNCKVLTKRKADWYKLFIRTSLRKADTLLHAWKDIPPPLKFILEECRQYIVPYTDNQLHAAESWSLHNRLGITKREDDSELDSLIAKGRKLMSAQAQFMDEKYLDKIYISIIYRLYEALDMYNRPTIRPEDLNRITASLSTARALSMIEDKEIYSCCSALVKHVISTSAEPPEKLTTKLTKGWSESFAALSNLTACYQAWTKIIPVEEDIEREELDEVISDISIKTDTATGSQHRAFLKISYAWLAYLT